MRLTKMCRVLTVFVVAIPAVAPAKASTVISTTGPPAGDGAEYTPGFRAGLDYTLDGTRKPERSLSEARS